MSGEQYNKKVIIALDVNNKNKAIDLIEKLSPPISYYKVGLELYTSEGNSFVEFLKNKGLKVFLDLKFLDIPNTVRKTVDTIARLKPDMITLHALGGRRMLTEAVETAKNINPCIKVLAVTILTSLDKNTFAETGIKQDINKTIINLAKMAKNSGCDGVVCSPSDAVEIRKNIKASFLIVTPGIRLPKDNSDDQRRIETPCQAIKKGADYLVIGRSITQNKNPREALKRVIDNLQSSAFKKNN